MTERLNILDVIQREKNINCLLYKNKLGTID